AKGTTRRTRHGAILYGSQDGEGAPRLLRRGRCVPCARRGERASTTRSKIAADVPFRIIDVSLRAVDQGMPAAHQLARAVREPAVVIPERLAGQREIEAAKAYGSGVHADHDVFGHGHWKPVLGKIETASRRH